ncbi:hypothetical protein [Hallella seregens]|uniref:Uncharacterized protein n=1 Tax=Hallella seregens ATCC 51272 TaxID=1336250 RepID=A0ABV5ZPT6_9BACT|nr:hypothetical protein [Hallella seregens]
MNEFYMSQYSELLSDINVSDYVPKDGNSEVAIKIKNAKSLKDLADIMSDELVNSIMKQIKL